MVSPNLGYTSTFTVFHRALILAACVLPCSPLAQHYEDRIEDKGKSEANLLDCANAWPPVAAPLLFELCDRG